MMVVEGRGSGGGRRRGVHVNLGFTLKEDFELISDVGGGG